MNNTVAEFQNVTLLPKANVYFEGKVVSHTFVLPDGSRKTAGLIYPGQFHFGTNQAERMEITDGSCTVKQDGQTELHTYAAGEHFDVPAHSGFNIEVQSSLCQYVCSYLN